MTATATLQERLTSLVLANPRVLSLYSVHPILADIASKTIGAATQNQQQPPAVLVQATATDTTVTLSVGLTGEQSAATVCRDLHDSISAEMTAAGAVHPFNIAVKISSIS